MPEAIEELIRQARRRWLRNLLLAQAARTACGAAGGLVVLLLLGTQVLDWRWLAGLLALSLAYGFHRTRGQRPSPYQVAQAVDRNLELRDALSTAYFFGRLRPERNAPEHMRAAQLAAAEALCRGADLRRAIPWRAPRAIYLAGALAACAVGLFSLRYGVSRRIDLGRSLPKIVLDTLRPPVERQAAKGKRADRLLQEYWQHFGVSLDEPAGEDRLASSMSPEGEPGRDSPEGVKPLELSVGAEDQEGAEGPGDQLALGTGQEQGQQSGAARRGDTRRPPWSHLRARKRFCAWRRHYTPRGGQGRCGHESHQEERTHHCLMISDAGVKRRQGPRGERGPR